MPTAAELLKQGRNEELWQMCCGFLSLSVNEFMDIQKSLLLQQLEVLNKCSLGKKLLHGAQPRTVEEFRQQVPLTTYKDYCPELIEKKEDALSEKPEYWVRTSGKSANYTCKWVPISATFAEELSKTLYGVGMLSFCNQKDQVDTKKNVSILYSVAPKPYISGTFADILRRQSPIRYLPALEKAENLSFEERINLGFKQAMSEGLEYFFGLSLVLVKVGDKIRESSNSAGIRPYLKSPKALWRLGRGKIRSRMAGRPMLPKDLWKVKGIISSGVDSIVYGDKIQELWGRKPLDIYSCTEGGVIATQAWDYKGMTFTPNLNFLEFIPEDEQLKLQMDSSYKPRVLLLDELKAGEKYEIVITNFHGGIMTRYRIGDMIKVSSLNDEKLSIRLPQMTFERRVDDIIDFAIIRLTEKMVWQALENSGVPYVDWIAYKKDSEAVLKICLELADGCITSEADVAEAIKTQITKFDDSEDKNLIIIDDLTKAIEFKLEITLLPRGTFSNYAAQRMAEGADLAHIKPPHINPPERVISMLTTETEETIIVTKSRTEKPEKAGTEKVTIK